MPKGKFLCVFADDSVFHGYGYGYDEDRGFHERMWQARLPMSANMIHADLSTPSGVQVMFGHNPYRQSVGRVLSVAFKGGRMIGEIELNEDDLKSAIAGGFEALAAGINSGLSAGFMFLDLPRTKTTKGEGTSDDPDKVEYGRLELREVSLTSIPRLTNAGIVRRLDATEPESKAADVEIPDGE